MAKRKFDSETVDIKSILKGKYCKHAARMDNINEKSLRTFLEVNNDSKRWKITQKMNWMKIV